MAKRIQFKSGRRHQDLADTRRFTTVALVGGVIITIIAFALFAGYMQ